MAKFRVRVRQHVNPLSRHYLVPVTPPNWEKVYSTANLPLHLDIGCGWGNFLLEMAQLDSERNFLGLEIREPLVEKANRERDELGLSNLHFISCSANASLEGILESLPDGVLDTVTIQFPDPWFKTRHAKRRVVQPELVETLAKYLVEGGMVFLQSDVKEVAEEMRNYFLEHFAFKQEHSEPWFESNPFEVPTERETLTLSRHDPVYRVLLKKVSADEHG